MVKVAVADPWGTVTVGRESEATPGLSLERVMTAPPARVVLLRVTVPVTTRLRRPLWIDGQTDVMSGTKSGLSGDQGPSSRP